MEFILAVISLALSIFVLVAIGKLFSINRNIERLVTLAERAQSRGFGPAPVLANQFHDGTPASERATNPVDMTDEELLARWRQTGSAADADILKSRGYHMG
jgi:hypothetical protein